MFPIPPLQDLPQLRPKQALLLLDLQNDFLSPNGAMAVKAPLGLLPRLVELVRTFRNAGHLVWTRTEFEHERPLGIISDIYEHTQIDPYDSDSASSVSSAEDITSCTNHDSNDAFLSKGRIQDCCLPGTAGAEFHPSLLPHIDSASDTLMKKSHYSAFESSPLLFHLRSKLINDLFICGSLSNISVYATALDAARHGFSITLIEDCLGYRCQHRHKMALHQLEEICGVEYLTSAEFLRQFRSQNPNDGRGARSEVPRPRNSEELELARAFEETTLEDQTAETSKTSENLRNPTNSKNARTLDASKSVKEKQDDQQPKGRGRIPVPRTPHTGGGPSNGKASISNVSRKLTLPLTVQRPRSDEKLNDTLQQLQRPFKTPQSTRQDRSGTEEENCIGEGDSEILRDFLPAEVLDGAFDSIKSEVKWQTMQHRGGEVPRLVAVQGMVRDDGFVPIYRHPADTQPGLSPFSPTIARIKDEVEGKIGHEVNHVLIQLYRRGQDNISEHSDKTMDIARESKIVNVSLGAQRTMVLRTKKGTTDGQFRQTPPDQNPPSRKIQRVILPHNSMFVLGAMTNMRWLHGIRPDKRETFLKSDAEKAFGGERISLTFRKISTFTDTNLQVIWGQGARGKTKEEAEPVSVGGTTEAEEMIIAFGKENHQSEFDWDQNYGKGFNVLDVVDVSSIS